MTNEMILHIGAGRPSRGPMVMERTDGFNEWSEAGSGQRKEANG